MHVTATRNFGPLTSIKLLTREDFGRVGRLARERIIRRTQAGTDEHGQAFRPYSEGYSERRAKEGHGTRVDLTVSGAMLQNINVDPDDDGVTLNFTT